MKTSKYTAEEIALEASLSAAANEEGTIQAGDMLALAPHHRPELHTTMSVSRAFEAITGTTPKRGPGQPVKEDKADKWLQLRLTGERKGAYVRASRPRKLSQWVFEHLDKAAGYQPGE